MRWQLHSVRSRLTVMYTLAFTLLILIYSASIYYLYRKNILSDFDRKLRKDVETVEVFLENNNFKKLKSENLDSNNWLSEIWTIEGKRIYTSGNESDYFLGDLNSSCKEMGIPYECSSDRHASVRGLCLKSEAYPEQYIIRVARLTERYQGQLSSFLSLMLFGAPLVIFLAGAIGYLLARQVLSPISKISTKAKLISAERLSERLPIENKNDELGELAETFNKTFERLEKSFEQMRRFTSDTSHELRTPLAAIRSLGEVALRQPQTLQNYQETISNILEESTRLHQLCEGLLLLSRADSGTLSFNLKKEKLQSVVINALQMIEILAEEKDQIIKIEISDHLMVSIDQAFFRQAIVNLIDNAIKYSPVGSTIQVLAKDKNNKIFLSIKDNGPGIESHHHSKIFDRFYRIDSGRSRTVGGAGLGLAITAWIVHTHQGELKIKSDNNGSEFIIEIPASNTNSTN